MPSSLSSCQSFSRSVEAETTPKVRLGLSKPWMITVGSLRPRLDWMSARTCGVAGGPGAAAFVVQAVCGSLKDAVAQRFAAKLAGFWASEGDGYRKVGDGHGRLRPIVGTVVCSS